MMFAELAKVMDHAMQNDNYEDSLNQNVINKNTKSALKESIRHLKTLYSFDINDPSFKGLKYFWQISEEKEKPILALLYAIGRDYLLAESISVISNTKPGEKATIDKLEENVRSFHTSKYSDITHKSISKNIASSWKQAGFITGKVKNIRTQPDIGYNIIAFAFLMAYLNELRGDFILTSKWVKALSLSDNIVRELAVEAAKRDLMQYQFAGNVTAISFNSLFKKLEINGI